MVWVASPNPVGVLLALRRHCAKWRGGIFARIQCRADLAGADRERLQKLSWGQRISQTHLALNTSANGRSSRGNGLAEGLLPPVEYSNGAVLPS
jgi:hypothetical protein